MDIQQKTIVAFRDTLLDWFKESGKDYPWRQTDSPYAILIAEVFLQRTQAKQVVPTYERFIRRFPTAISLATADVEDIEHLISPLGLKKKAKQIKETAVQLVRKHAGEVPRNASELGELVGIGPYSANALLVFAFGYRLPVVDANVVRVFKRVFGIESMKKRPRTDPALWQFAQMVLPLDNIAQYTWALIDFAADVCKARRPDCNTCPMRAFCDLQIKER